MRGFYPGGANPAQISVKYAVKMEFEKSFMTTKDFLGHAGFAGDYVKNEIYIWSTGSCDYEGWGGVGRLEIVRMIDMWVYR